MSEQIPLWQILGWREADGVVLVPGSCRWTSSRYADDRVTEAHMLDWLDANAEKHGGWREPHWDDLKPREWRHYAVDKRFGVWGEVASDHADRRTAIEMCLRQVYAAIGGAS